MKTHVLQYEDTYTAACGHAYTSMRTYGARAACGHMYSSMRTYISQYEGTEDPEDEQPQLVLQRRNSCCSVATRVAASQLVLQRRNSCCSVAATAPPASVFTLL
jgi:hypothetical protein